MPSSSRVTCERRISATEGDEQEDIGGLHVTVLRDTTPFVGVIGAQAPHVVRSRWSSAIPSPRRMPRRSEAEPRRSELPPPKAVASERRTSYSRAEPDERHNHRQRRWVSTLD